MQLYSILLVAGLSTSAWALIFKPMRSFQRTSPQETDSQLNAVAEKDKNLFSSKLLPPLTEQELEELFKEYNITAPLDPNADTELMKWSPSSEFFEKVAFQNLTQRYERTVMNVKMDFYGAYNVPLLPQYKTFIADFMEVGHIQAIDARFKYDPIYAFGLCTQYYTIMKGYALQDEIDTIFNQLMKAFQNDPAKIRDDAKRVLTAVKESTLTEEEFLNQNTGEIGEVFNYVRSNRFFKYTEAWGIGLARIMELRGVEPTIDNLKRWATALRFVSPNRLSTTWTEFSGDQIRMQSVEGMQKQLMIREKKRAAERLEKEAAEFEEKKKALMELNQAILDRRNLQITDSKAILKRIDPVKYQEILKREGIIEVEETKVITPDTPPPLNPTINDRREDLKV